MVILFGSESWVLPMAMEKTAEGTHTNFLRQITGNRARRRTDVTWVTMEAKEVWEAAGTQSAATYIVCRYRTVAQWVALRLIFEVCVREKQRGKPRVVPISATPVFPTFPVFREP